MIKIIIHKQSKGIKILAPILKKELDKIGEFSQVIVGGDLDKISAKSQAIFFVLTPHKFTNFRRVNKRAKFIMYQQEQLLLDSDMGIFRFKQLKKFIDLFDHIVDVSELNLPAYGKLGRKVDYILPTAYHEDFEYNCSVEDKIKYDCLFFGRYSDKPRRKEILNKLNKEFNFYPKFEGIYDFELKKAIKQSKIILNIHQSDGFFPEWLRIILGIANKRLVISEPLKGIAPLNINRDIIVARDYELPKKIFHYLNDRDDYDKVVQEAYNLVKKRYRMENYVKEMAHKLL